MRYISLFSGIEACSVGWHHIGWTPVAFADFDAFPSAVLEYHYPTVSNLGDVTKVNWHEYRGKAEVVVRGSPCRSYLLESDLEWMTHVATWPYTILELLGQFSQNGSSMKMCRFIVIKRRKILPYSSEKWQNWSWVRLPSS